MWLGHLHVIIPDFYFKLLLPKKENNLTRQGLPNSAHRARSQRGGLSTNCQETKRNMGVEIHKTSSGSSLNSETWCYFPLQRKSIHLKYRRECHPVINITGALLLKYIGIARNGSISFKSAIWNHTRDSTSRNLIAGFRIGYSWAGRGIFSVAAYANLDAS